MKKRFRQLLSMALAASMVVSVPMSALAEDGGLKRKRKLPQIVRMTAILWLRL